MSRDIRIPAEAAAALAKGQRIEAIRQVREANHGVDLRGAMEALDAHASGRHGHAPQTSSMGASAPLDGLPAEAMTALSRGQPIEAIKIVREMTGLGLKEAKDMVERYRNDASPERDEAMRAKLEGFAGKHGFKIPQAAMAAVERGDLKAAMNSSRQAGNTHLGSVPTGSNPLGTVRGIHTVSRETNQHGWLWALALLAALAAGYSWLA
ncbi:MAG: 50S ribosomal protein L7/L12 [Pseudoxanthomonas sp.]